MQPETNNLSQNNNKFVATKPTEHCILIIDDDQNLVLTIKEKLYNVDNFLFTVETATDPYMAIELMKTLKQEGVDISLIISDLSMPGMQGNELLEESMKYYPDSKKILMSGNPTLDAIIHTINTAHLYRMLTKPIEDLDFQTTIRQAIEAVETELKLKQTNEKLLHLNTNLEHIVDEKLQEIKQNYKQLTDSINSAGLVQKSELSCETEFAHDIHTAFSPIIPKAILCGDFFWFYNA